MFGSEYSGDKNYTVNEIFSPLSKVLLRCITSFYRSVILYSKKHSGSLTLDKFCLRLLLLVMNIVSFVQACTHSDVLRCDIWMKLSCSRKLRPLESTFKVLTLSFGQKWKSMLRFFAAHSLAKSSQFRFIAQCGFEQQRLREFCTERR